jgi:hypothetical protein
VYVPPVRTKKLYAPEASVVALPLEVPCNSTWTEGTPAPFAWVIRPDNLMPTVAVSGINTHPPFDMNAAVPANAPGDELLNPTTVGDLAPAPRLYLAPDTSLNRHPLCPPARRQRLPNPPRPQWRRRATGARRDPPCGAGTLTGQQCRARRPDQPCTGRNRHVDVDKWIHHPLSNGPILSRERPLHLSQVRRVGERECWPGCRRRAAG